MSHWLTFLVPDEVSFNWRQCTRPEIVALAISVGRKVMPITSVTGALDGGLMGHALRQGRPPPVLYDIAFARCGFCARASEEADPAFLKEVVRSHGARLSYSRGFDADKDILVSSPPAAESAPMSATETELRWVRIESELRGVIGPAGLSISCATSRMAIEEANKPLR
ncbi:hypothetical protein B0H13DRAFT_1854810 [Mycena leptocephala]|nr:hypothetical protein B0H13DRAFT_1854810 [Mycena leptocephala]